ncbi:MAG: SDR family NAD(P)-dependent oxidoreductase [Pseudomonadota bacterium]
MESFEGKTALISGGAEGIGLSIAKALGEQKMNIVLADINRDSLDAAAKELQNAGINVLALPLDVADEDQWLQVVEQTVTHFGKLHMLVNNAGVGGEPRPLQDQSMQTWRWTIDVNLMGVVYGAQAALRHMTSHDEGGWIVNVASMAGLGGLPYGGVYNATKSAVVSLSEGWALELADQGVKVSVVCPGFVKTRIYESQRNRPERYHADGSQEVGSHPMDQAAKEAVQGGIDVAIVGKRLVEALDAGDLYVFTDTGIYRSAVAQRFEVIEAGFESAARSQVLLNATELS